MDLIEKIRKVEALLLAAKGEGERRAALLAKLSSRELEYTIRLGHMSAKRLFTALCHKYSLFNLIFPFSLSIFAPCATFSGAPGKGLGLL